MADKLINVGSINAQILFSIHFEEDRIPKQDVSINVNSAQEIEGYFRLYYEKSWDELFLDDWDGDTAIAGASFNGFIMSNDGQGEADLFLGIRGPYKQSRCVIKTGEVV